VTLDQSELADVLTTLADMTDDSTAQHDLEVLANSFSEDSELPEYWVVPYAECTFEDYGVFVNADVGCFRIIKRENTLKDFLHMEMWSWCAYGFDHEKDQSDYNWFCLDGVDHEDIHDLYREHS